MPTYSARSTYSPYRTAQIVSHHLLRWRARRAATKLNERHQSKYGESDFYYTVEKYQRGRYKYKVVLKRRHRLTMTPHPDGGRNYA